jgi:hypothetical protein
VRHPVFENDLRAIAKELGTALTPICTTTPLAQAIHRVFGITVAVDHGLTLTPHEALSAIGERLLPIVPHAANSRTIAIVLAALHLELCGPLPVGNWGGFTTPEIVGCPTCVRNHHTRFVKMPGALAYATAYGMLDPRWSTDAENDPRWVRLMWRYRTELVLERAVAQLTPHGFWIDLDTDHQILSAIRPLNGEIARARSFGGSHFTDLEMTWYGAEIHLTALTPAGALRTTG